MMMRRMIRLAAVMVTAVALTFGVGATSANAGEWESISTARAGAIFWPAGDYLEVYDYKADGLGARAYLSWGYGHQVSVSVNNTDYMRSKKLNLREGTVVWLRLCYTKHGHNVQCSRAQKAVA